MGKVQILMLIAALSVDVFLASAACGAERIRIGGKTALAISAVCSGVLFLSLAAGTLLGGVIRERYATMLCFAGLLLVGLYKLAECGVRAWLKRHRFLHKQFKVTFSQIKFILNIYNDPVKADRDHSSVMSVQEGVFFALAMSFDGLFGGLGAAFLGIDIRRATLGNFILSFLAVCAGSALGRAAAGRERDLSWLGGALFVVLAFSKLV